MDIKLENIKTQEDLNKVLKEAQTEGAKSAAARYKTQMEGMIPKEEYEDLKTKYTANKLSPEVRKMFMEAGGIETAAEDFFKHNRNKILEMRTEDGKLDSGKVKNFIKEIKQDKSYMFSEKATASTDINKALEAGVNGENKGLEQNPLNPIVVK